VRAAIKRIWEIVDMQVHSLDSVITDMGTPEHVTQHGHTRDGEAATSDGGRSIDQASYTEMIVRLYKALQVGGRAHARTTERPHDEPTN
jgi:hypothetical protein